jgi:hypothetical protein
MEADNETGAEEAGTGAAATGIGANVGADVTGT